MKRLEVGGNSENQKRTVKRHYESCFMNAMISQISESTVIYNSLNKTRTGCYFFFFFKKNT